MIDEDRLALHLNAFSATLRSRRKPDPGNPRCRARFDGFQQDHRRCGDGHRGGLFGRFFFDLEGLLGDEIVGADGWLDTERVITRRQPEDRAPLEIRP